jgi:hypothetical protein
MYLLSRSDESRAFYRNKKNESRAYSLKYIMKRGRACKSGPRTATRIGIGWRLPRCTWRPPVLLTTNYHLRE